MNKSYQGEEIFFSAKDAEDFENGTGSPYGPSPLGLGAYFMPCAVYRPSQAELGLCKHSDGEKIFDRMTQTCLGHYSHHLQRREERAWGYP
jgi:hypothetical protein